MARDTCPWCNGKKGTHEQWGIRGKGWYPCSKCGGKGYIFTADPPKEKRVPKPNRPPHEHRPKPEQRQRTDRPQPNPTSKWLEKPCPRGCGNTIHYLPSWDKPPQLCKSCKEKGADIFRAELIPSGWHSSIGETQVDKAHGTMVFRGKGTNGKDYRVSWDSYGNAHWTDQGLDKNDPNRHRDPRK
jgi:hypothetical protein